MKLENRTQKVTPLPHFLFRLARYGLFAFGLILFSLTIGILGYHYIGKVSWIDSFHMTSMILAGMGPVVELKTTSAKIFSSFYALYSGITFLSVAAIFFTPIFHRILHIFHVEEDEN